MDPEAMRTRTLEVLGRFASLKHDDAKRQVLCAGGHYSRTNSDLFDGLVDELVAAGVVLRDQRFGWVRLAPEQSQATPSPLSHPSPSSPRTGRAAVLRKGGRHA